MSATGGGVLPSMTSQQAPRRRYWLARALVALGLVLASGGAAQTYLTRTLPADGAAAEGLLVDGRPLGPGERPADVALARAEELLARRVTLVDPDGGAVVAEASLSELGASVDVGALGQAI